MRGLKPRRWQHLKGLLWDASLLFDRTPLAMVDWSYTREVMIAVICFRKLCLVLTPDTAETTWPNLTSHQCKKFSKNSFLLCTSFTTDCQYLQAQSTTMFLLLTWSQYNNSSNRKKNQILLICKSFLWLQLTVIFIVDICAEYFLYLLLNYENCEICLWFHDAPYVQMPCPMKKKKTQL